MVGEIPSMYAIVLMQEEARDGGGMKVTTLTSGAEMATSVVRPCDTWRGHEAGKTKARLSNYVLLTVYDL